ncbi:PREDICTED: A-kinase anchor protein 5-like [Acanthisitta chloris]|uniref:A-kinase anchor protein 5-like n=1 Tax=Acanthisitta chloris TaxID=57068 RepID=UPI0004F0FB16|nr:PREDICTED: A-kinase anchor protein 5-like [Acanthisitta chloris]
MVKVAKEIQMENPREAETPSTGATCSPSEEQAEKPSMLCFKKRKKPCKKGLTVKDPREGASEEKSQCVSASQGEANVSNPSRPSKGAWTAIKNLTRPRRRQKSSSRMKVPSDSQVQLEVDAEESCAQGVLKKRVSSGVKMPCVRFSRGRKRSSPSEAVEESEDSVQANEVVGVLNKASEKLEELAPTEKPESFSPVSAEEDHVTVKEDQDRVKEDQDRVKEDQDRVKEDQVTAKEDQVTAKEDQVTAKEDQVTAKEDQVTAKEDQVTAKEDQVTAKEDQVTAKEDQVTAKEDQVTAKEDQVTAKEDQVTAKEDQVTAKEDQVTAKEDQVTAKEDQVTAKEDQVTAKEDQVTAKEDQVTAKEDQVTAKEDQVTAKEDQVTAKEDQVTAKEDQVTAKEDQVTAKEDQVTAKEDQVTAKEDQVTAKEDQVTAKEDQVTAKEDQVTAKEDQVTAKEDQVTAKEDQVTAKEDQVTAKEDQVTAKEDQVTAKEDQDRVKEDQVTVEDQDRVKEDQVTVEDQDRVKEDQVTVEDQDRVKEDQVTVEDQDRVKEDQDRVKEDEDTVKEDQVTAKEDQVAVKESDSSIGKRAPLTEPTPDAEEHTECTVQLEITDSATASETAQDKLQQGSLPPTVDHVEGGEVVPEVSVSPDKPGSAPGTAELQEIPTVCKELPDSGKSPDLPEEAVLGLSEEAPGGAAASVQGCSSHQGPREASAGTGIGIIITITEAEDSDNTDSDQAYEPSPVLQQNKQKGNKKSSKNADAGKKEGPEAGGSPQAEVKGLGEQGHRTGEQYELLLIETASSLVKAAIQSSIEQLVSEMALEQNKHNSFL